MPEQESQSHSISLPSRGGEWYLNSVTQSQTVMWQCHSDLAVLLTEASNFAGRTFYVNQTHAEPRFRRAGPTSTKTQCYVVPMVRRLHPICAERHEI